MKSRFVPFGKIAKIMKGNPTEGTQTSIMKGNPTEGTQTSIKMGNVILKKTEKLMLHYMERQKRNNVPIDGRMIREKAKKYYADVARLNNVQNHKPFKASVGG